MSFRISTTVSNGISLVNLHDDEQSVTVSVAPDFGAMLHAFDFPLQAGRFNIINNYSSAADIEATLASSYKSSKLSPFACRIRNGQYTLNGQLYEFSRKFPDGSAIHGLLFNKKFALTNQTVTDFMASVEFRYSYMAEDAGYPFSYTCTIRYTLFPDKTLQLQTTLQNDSNQAIPMADGWHPYFKLPSPLDSCTLQFSCDGMLEFSDALIPTGNILPFTSFDQPTILANRQLDNCFLLPENASQPVCILCDPATKLSISFTADENYPYLQIYTPDDRQSIAIENLSAAPDSFNNKMGLLLLEPGDQRSLSLHYQVKTSETA